MVNKATNQIARAHKKGRKVFIVLPCYNEESRLGTLLERIDEAMGDASMLYQIIVVDDGSIDSTASIVKPAKPYMGH